MKHNLKRSVIILASTQRILNFGCGSPGIPSPLPMRATFSVTKKMICSEMKVLSEKQFVANPYS